MLQLADIFFTVLHFAIVLFNLFGWIPRRTRKVHFACILITAASWFILGIWFGIGYCPITDWQWDVKHKLGEHNLPPNFIEYYAEKITGHDFSSQFIEIMIGVCFGLAALASVWVNFGRRKESR